jgi:hypothetical protein
MKNKSITYFIWISCCLCKAPAADLTHYVNPFIGTVPGSGNTYPKSLQKFFCF